MKKFETIHGEVKRIFGKDKLLNRITIEDMKSNESNFYLLKSEVLSIISFSSSVIKGFLLHFLKDVGEI
ncbi:hypothetical protein [Thermosipho melanesiensis]|uniref:hypothetical protein n=1 Tax=Thermosipho melanesiensis TaxID=46541 RepID=UPI00117F7198|nr:hypothetical protein [Thermosipho melanesiensis]